MTRRNNATDNSDTASFRTRFLSPLARSRARVECECISPGQARLRRRGNSADESIAGEMFVCDFDVSHIYIAARPGKRA